MGSQRDMGSRDDTDLCRCDTFTICTKDELTLYL